MKPCTRSSVASIFCCLWFSTVQHAASQSTDSSSSGNDMSPLPDSVEQLRSWSPIPPPESPIELEVKVNLETKRIADSHLAFVLNSIKGPGPPSRNWEFVQKMKKVLLGYCPSLSPYILNGMMRMFRHLFRIYEQTYMNSIRPGYSKRDKRILETLDTCYTQAKPIPIEPCFDYSNSSLPDDVQFKLRLEEPAKPNATDPKDTGLKTVPNGHGHDFPIETIWKIFLFSHYQCASAFGKSSLDLSSLYMKIETMLNPGIRYRWTRPGLSFVAYQTAFLSYDLKRFAYILDHCVSQAKTSSHYPQWILRPLSINGL